MTTEDYCKELDLFKEYMLSVRIPYLKQYYFQRTEVKNTYYNQHWLGQGKVFPVHISCWSQIPSFEDYKKGRDTTYFGTIIT